MKMIFMLRLAEEPVLILTLTDKCLLLRPPPARESNFMTFEGFLRYMESKDCCVFDQAHTSVYQDMDQPLTSYFISSSHNTYLTGDQLVGKSHLDAYLW